MSDFLPPPRLIAVVLNRPVLSRLTYELPDHLAEEVEQGCLVEVPLGTKKEIGCVVDMNPPPPDESATFRVRSIIRRVAPGFVLAQEIIDLAAWIADYYFCSHGEALAATSQIGFSDVEYRPKASFRLAADFDESVLTAKQRDVVQILRNGGHGELESVAAVARAAACTPAVVKKLLEAGVLLQETLEPQGLAEVPEADARPELYPEQVEAFEAVRSHVTDKQFGVFLLHGVTGSGKTEVYLRLIEEALNAGRTALCLVPEISLTPQTVDRFQRRFRQEVGVFHSQLTRPEKRVLYEKIRRGAIRLVIGARSATFAPLPDLGIIIIDEEHESSYKQGETPRYHARDVAIMRASRLKIPVLLGSATPSLESYENAVKGKYKLLRLTQRPPGVRMPHVELVPMGRQISEDVDLLTMMSPELKQAVDERLAKGEQSLLFLNRRGFSNFLLCPACRWVARCLEDDIVLTIHRRKGQNAIASKGEDLLEGQEEMELFPKALDAKEAYLKCHFCGQMHEYFPQCPHCGEKELIALGTGTQRVEEMLRRMWPEASILRLDQDSVGGRQGFLRAWQQMVNGEAQIILGTQMIAKGLHLERVTLVGVILADVGLFIPDFRAEERTFSLLMQVAGRAGRSNMGEVLVQTYMPHHTAIQLASKHDYETFFAVEMQRRRKMRFPPVQRLIALTISDEDLTRTVNAARQLGGLLRRLTHKCSQPPPVVLGPQAAPIEKLANRYRQRILIRGEHHKINAQLLRMALRDREWHPPSSIRLAIDVDPQDLL